MNDLIMEPVDAFNLTEKFTRLFKPRVETRHGSRYIAVSYVSSPESKNVTQYADGTKIESYSEGVVSQAWYTLSDDKGQVLLSAEMHFKKERDGNSVASVTIQDECLCRLSIFIIPDGIEQYCHEIYFGSRPS